eukprot:CAMPEP_0183291844 /NCGR_PEP_ID=MMETSP0160_2-20130417/1122_1 /TAXON_ID=2839 ORGANISM="Odontella Sinensis, Strain Grunow 1884" /NCGR_SAMPLE_ID=MMETSP0160_2 /ASSEMBLY_ACC=CAM_ASM_000250 /LENGTH=88 /DNA_ID=CAMNT_0025452703 /DNA_START=164 /DNA_END=427 /DNA_ORIENTATION=+
MCGDIGETSRCCVGYSAVGFIFTLWVGIMIKNQPFYIGGLEDAEIAEANAFGAMYFFAATFALSVVGIMVTGNDKKEEDSAGGPEGYQ